MDHPDPQARRPVPGRGAVLSSPNAQPEVGVRPVKEDAQVALLQDAFAIASSLMDGEVDLEQAITGDLGNGSGPDLIGSDITEVT